MSQDMVQRKPNTRLEICKAAMISGLLDFSKSRYDSLHLLESFDFVKFTENIELPAI